MHCSHDRNCPAVLLVCFFLLTNFLLVQAQDALLRVLVKDAATGLPTPCTIAISDANGKLLSENESFRAGFRCPGQFTKQLPPGRTRLRITRGFETEAVSRDLDLAPGSKTDLTFILKRRVDLRRRGWYAGDSHVHMLHGERTVPVGFDFVALSARAEDLQYLSLAQAWSIPDPTPEALEAELGRRSTPDCTLTWNVEAPKNYYQGDAGRCLGHCWNLATRGRTKDGHDVIRALLDASAWDYESAKPSYANFESHALIHAQGGAVFYSHPARWWTGSWGGQGGYPKVDRMRISNMAVELPLDTLIGPTFDGLDILTGSGEHAANALAFELWSLLLNHGYRLAPSGSSDSCFDRPGGAVPGIVRTYTFMPGGFSLRKAARATAAGRTFVTTGPLLAVSLAGAPPGSAFHSGNRDHDLSIEAWASGEDPRGLDRIEILRNGRPFREIPHPDHPTSVSTNLLLRESKTAWYCVRAFGSDPQKQIAISGAFYFADRHDQPPSPARAQVHARILDAHSGQLLPGTLTEMLYEGTLSRTGKRHSLKTGDARLLLPGTVRLRAEAAGYQPQVLSPFLDHPPLVEFITRLSAEDLVKWETFERIQALLNEVPLTFRMQRVP